MWKGLAAIVALEVLLLAAVVGAVISSEPDSSFPAQRISPGGPRTIHIRPVSVKVAPRAPARGGQSLDILNTNPDSGRV
ncbi:MAG TPA: hypothetical protein VFD90_03550 [Gaiellales bacterium]|jgi:hypothetical protein|nr:hypothetical protein [Gaiellales bacterium]